MTPAENDYGFSFDPVDTVLEEDQKDGLGRRLSRYMQRSAEAIASLPGGFVELGRGIAELTGGVTPKEELPGIMGFGRELLEKIPTPAEIRARGAEVHPELEPKDSWEEIEDEWVEDIATLAATGPARKGLSAGKAALNKVFRAIGTSTVGNLTKQGIKEFGGSEALQETGKLGSMLFFGMFGKGRGVRSYISNQYRNASQFVPEGAAVRYPIDKLENVERSLLKGGITPSKEKPLEFIQKMKAKISDGSMLVEEAVQFDKDLNEWIRKSPDTQLRGNWKRLQGVNQSGLDIYSKENPSFGDSYQEAKMAHKGIAQSQDLQRFIRRNANLKNLTYSAALLGLEESFIPGSAGLKLGTAGAIGTGWWMKEVGKRLATNPALRRYYQNVLTASANQNQGMLQRSLAGLERAAKKEFEENPLEFDLSMFEETQQ